MTHEYLTQGSAAGLLRDLCPVGRCHALHHQSVHLALLSSLMSASWVGNTRFNACQVLNEELSLS